MISRTKIVKIISSILVGAMLLPAFTGAVNAAEPEAQKKVRIGYMMYDGYQNGGEGEVKSGSAYEYFQRIKGYTDWEYEYVYGSFSEVLEMLEKGDVDIVSCMTYSEEREGKFLFSTEAHGEETYFLYTHLDNNDITPAKKDSLNGKTVGVTLDSRQESYFREWCESKKISCNIVCYEYIDDLHDALTNKEVDAIVAVRSNAHGEEAEPWKSIYRFKSEPLYFAVNKERTDLLAELNDAQAYIIATNEYYSYDVMKKYHDGINYYNTYLTAGQKKYLENYGTIKVGYLEGPILWHIRTRKQGKCVVCAQNILKQCPRPMR